ncbi:amino acid permease, partial [Pantoea ananatis]
MSEQTTSSQDQFKRTMKVRHLVMLSLGGVIGTGLFFNTGYIISTTGAAGTLLAYL